MNIKPAYQVHELCYALNIVGEMKVLVEANKYFNHNLLNILVDEFDSSPQVKVWPANSDNQQWKSF